MSNQTRSDGSDEPNERAVNTLLPEARVYASDPGRVYATGFSGTAILAWLAGMATGKLAGVIGVGGRLVDGAAPAKFSFAHYGFAGDCDFNNREMRLIDEMLEREGKVPHRFQAFDGDHQHRLRAHPVDLHRAPRERQCAGAVRRRASVSLE